MEELEPEPAGIPLEIEGGIAIADVNLVMLVGLPGKSPTLLV